MKIDYKAMEYLICLLYLMKQKVKDKFPRMLDLTTKLDYALYQMIKAKKFPEWFSKNFHYIAYYGELHGLRDALSLAYSALLIRLDGSEYRYHLDKISDLVINNFIKEESFDKQEIQKLANELSDLVLASDERPKTARYS